MALACSSAADETIGGNASQYGYHLPITVTDALQSLAYLLHGGRQNPFAEGSAFAQGTGLASKDRDIVPGIIDSIATAEAALVFRDRHAILFDDDPDYRKLQQGLGPNNGGNSVVKLVSETTRERIYSVASGDAGYSEAGCLIADKRTHLAGCGYNGMYNVMLDQGQCNLKDVEERSQFVPRLATFKPDTPISALGQAIPAPPSRTHAANTSSAVCTVLSAIVRLDRQPCSVALSLGEVANGKRVDRYEFVWPTGNKTIISKDGDTLYINRKIARPVVDTAYTFCVLNSNTGNPFCFKS